MKISKILLSTAVALGSQVGSASTLAALASMATDKLSVLLAEKGGLKAEAANELAVGLQASVKAMQEVSTGSNSGKINDVLGREMPDNDLGKGLSQAFRDSEVLGSTTAPVILCSSCLSQDLKAFGLTAIPKVVRNDSVVLEILSNAPTAVSDMNKSSMNSAKKLWENTQVKLTLTPDFLAKNSDSARGIYIALNRMSQGNAAEKSFAKEFLTFLKQGDGSAALEQSDLWRIISDPSTTDQDLAMWSAVLSKVNAAPGSDLAMRKGNLIRELENAVGQDPNKKEALDSLKKLNCWKLF
jgi:hypothetical protein